MSAIDKLIDLVDTMQPRAIFVRPDGYFTASEFAIRTGISITMAREKLLKLQRAGRIERLSINEDGHVVFVYGLPDAKAAAADGSK
jgi:hypothetical protein